MEIYRAQTKTDANRVVDRFIKTYEAESPEAAECLAKDRDVLLAFYDFPADTGSIFARPTRLIDLCHGPLRTVKTRGAVSTETVLPFVFKLVQSAQNRWLRIRGFNQLGEVIQVVRFRMASKLLQKN